MKTINDFLKEEKNIDGIFLRALNDDAEKKQTTKKMFDEEEIKNRWKELLKRTGRYNER